MISAQILNDSSQSKYSLRTTYLFTEDDLRPDTINFFSYDSLPEVFQRYEAQWRNNTAYQDLGNFGTATRMLFPQLPQKIGQRSGFDVYNLFAPDPHNTLYANTLAPYSYFKYINGVKGQSYLRTALTRNISPNWNMGFNFDLINSKHQIGQTEDNEFQTKSYNFCLHGNYLSSNGRYRVLYNYSFFDHLTYETGGIFPKKLETINDWFDYEVEQVRLNPSARTRDDRHNYYAYQDYALDTNGTIRLFSRHKRTVQHFRYYDEAPTTNLDTLFYPLKTDSAGKPILALADTNTINDVYRYLEHEHYLGVKYAARKLESEFYFRYRSIDYRNTRKDTLDTDTNLTPTHREHFWGAQVKYMPNQRIVLRAFGEGQPKHDYQFGIHTHIYGANIKFRRIFYSPTLAMQRFFGNAYQWNYTGGQILADEFIVDYTFTNKWLKLRPFAEIINYVDYVYLDEQSRPQSTTAPLTVNTIGAEIATKMGSFNFELNARNIIPSGPDVIRVPKLYAFTTIYYQNRLFNNSLLLRTGIEGWNRGQFKSDAYNPVTGQWQLGTETLGDYIKLDYFINLKINQFTLYIRYAHLNQGLGARGYFVSPWYPGARTGFEFGFGWHLFE